MTERLVSRRLFWQTPVSGLTVSGPISSSIDLRTGIVRLESLTFVASSVASNPNFGFFYALSPDNVTWGSFADNATLLASMGALSNPQGYNALALPTALANFIRFSVSGIGSNPSDALLTADLVLRMSQ